MMDRITAVLELGEGPREYEFLVDRRQDSPELHIPGHHRGPDNCTPQCPEQERWLDGLTETVTRVWDCRWKFTSRQACDGFVQDLREAAARTSP